MAAKTIAAATTMCGFIVFTMANEIRVAELF